MIKKRYAILAGLLVVSSVVCIGVKPDYRAKDTKTVYDVLEKL